MDKAPTRVLLITNDAQDREHIHRLVGNYYRLIDAASGSEGLELFNTEPIDCALLDYALPDIDGLDCLKRLLDSHRHVTVVVVADGGDERTAVETIKQGAQDYLVKASIGREELRRVIEDAVEQVNQRRNAEEKQQELENFVWTAAHDLKAPLNNIYYVIETTKLIELATLAESTLDCFESVVGQVIRLSELIDNLLDYARTGHEEKPLEVVALDGVMEQVLTHLAASVREQEARFHIEPMPEVQGDRLSLVQLFQNLIGNALKFRGDDPPVVSISAVPTDDTWTISVRDNGIGINPAFHREVFAPLRRLNRPGRYEGHGLGLAICRKIIDPARGGERSHPLSRPLS